MFIRTAALAAFAGLALAAGAAKAGAVYTLDAYFNRISDTVAELTFSGAIADTRESFIIENVVIGGSGNPSVTGNLMLGTSSFNYAMIYDGTDLLMDFAGFQDAGTEITGTGVLTLGSGVWAPQGTTGTVQAGEPGTAVMGPIASAPLPPALALSGLGMAALGLIGRRRRRV